MTPTLEETVAKARAAQKAWGEVPVSERIRWLKRFQKAVIQNSEQMIAAIREDTGKPATEALGIEIATVVMTADYYRKTAKKFLKTRRAKTHWMFKNKKVWVRRVPYGVVGILGPSNLPFSLTIGDAIPALLAGSAVILKPSEWTPRSAEVGTALALQTGLPEGLLQVVQGGSDVGARLIEQADLIFFTGSTAVGRKVAEKAGTLLKPCILELGGKAPMIVLNDADIERAARACVWGRFAHSGQHCIAIERVYVAEEIAETFIQRVIHHTQAIAPEMLSPLKLPKTLPHLQELLQDALKQGAKIAWQGPQKEKGPTILTGVQHSMRVLREESFGPLLPIMTFSDPRRAIELANDSASGLSAIVFTKNKSEGLKIAEQIESGNVSINDGLDHFMILDAPFGGWKASGLGVRHAREGLLQFTRPQTLFVHSFPLPFCRKREFWWFPYRRGTNRLLKGLLRFFFG